MANMQLSANALRVLEARYLRRDQERRIVETPAELFHTVARVVAQGEALYGSPGRAEFWEERFHELITDLDFLPNSPTLMNAGKPLGQLSACFVLPVEDSLEGIFDAIKAMALIQRTGGGTGFSFSRLRPRGDLVASTAGEASGPLSFLRVFDCATESVKQGGKRRGANMGVLRVDHPDILEFIDAKRENGALSNFNLSVAVTDAFMEAEAQDHDYALRHPRTGAQAGMRRAREIFSRLVDAAWSTGDPGVLFLDAINRANPTPHLGPLEATNPCGEIPLLPYESCNLGSINLAHMVRSDGQDNVVDEEKLRRTVRDAIRFLDNVITVNGYPLPEIGRTTRANRKIGLGVMGFAEMLIRLGIPYHSAAAATTAETIMATIAAEALQASVHLAEERGVFPNWRGSVYEARGLRVRHATRTAIAPTGTLSILGNTTAGIEPLFAVAYRRSQVLGGQTLMEINPLFLEMLERSGGLAPDALAEVLHQGRVAKLRNIPETLRRLFVTALEIPAEHHLLIQASFQRHVDNSVAKTINLPRDASPGDVADAYRLAWALGLKGVTVFRYGSKSSQVLQLGVEEEPLHYDHASRCDPEECKL
jgi:ribonucleoside-diphosphate reductase alpha chain